MFIKKQQHLFQVLTCIDCSALFLSDNMKYLGSIYYMPSDAECAKECTMALFLLVRPIMPTGYPKNL